MLDAIDFESEAFLAGRSHGIVKTHTLDKTAVAAIARVGGNDVVERTLLGAATGESENNHGEPYEFSRIGQRKARQYNRADGIGQPPVARGFCAKTTLCLAVHPIPERPMLVKPAIPNAPAMSQPVVKLCAMLTTMLALASPPLMAQDLKGIRLPPGFQIEVLSNQVPGARQMALGRFADGRGTLYVGSRSARVYAVSLDNNRVTGVRTVAGSLEAPIGVAWRDGALYVSAISRILRFDDIDNRLDKPPSPVVISDRFPSNRHHGGKFIAFGPDGLLYVPVGAPCNACEREENRYANINRMKPDGTGFEVFATGVRNTVGFDWHPSDKTLWFTDNGRDMMGDDIPNDELNHAPRKGMNFGFPYCHQGDTPDPQFGSKRPCSASTPPAALVGPHVAALGMRFYTGNMFPAEYRNNIFIAQHGSWNRSKRIGYRVVRVVLDGQGKVVRQEPFAEGWLMSNDAVNGRPVDVLVMPDGALLVSDDSAGAIYRISYRR